MILAVAAIAGSLMVILFLRYRIPMFWPFLLWFAVSIYLMKDYIIEIDWSPVARFFEASGDGSNTWVWIICMISIQISCLSIIMSRGNY